MLQLVKSFDDEFGTNVEVNGNTKYPFQWMRIGESFAVPIHPGIIYSVRMAIHYHQKRTGKKFKLIRHHEFNCAEVGRVK